MTQQPFPPQAPGRVDPGAPPDGSGRPPAARWVLWLTVGFLIAAAVIGGVFIIVGDDGDIAGRVWLTFILVMFFAGAAVLDATLDGNNRWYIPASTITNVVLLLVGLLKIWTSWLQVDAETRERRQDFFDQYGYYRGNVDGPEQFVRFLGIIMVLRLAILTTQFVWSQLVMKSKRPGTQLASKGVLCLFWLSALIVVVPLSFPGIDWPGWWWRIAGAAVLAAVVLLVIPVVFRAFEPKPPKPVAPIYPPQYYQGMPQGGQPPMQPQFRQPPFGQPPVHPQYNQPWPGQPGPQQFGSQQPGPQQPGPGSSQTP
ncbi:MAG: hypothetical protein ACTII7_04315 [Galactobacter sp.]